MESNPLKKSPNNSVASRFLRVLSESMMWMDFSISGLIQLGNRALYTFTAIEVSYASVDLSDSMVTFLREGEDADFCLSLNWILFISGIAKSKKSVIKCPCLLYFWRNFVDARSFSDFNFCQLSVKLFLL